MFLGVSHNLSSVHVLPQTYVILPHEHGAGRYEVLMPLIAAGPSTDDGADDDEDFNPQQSQRQAA